MPSYTQRNRLINVTTPLGEDVLLLQSVSGSESISALFEYTLEMMAENTGNVKFEDLLGHPVTVEVLIHNGGSRYVNGIVSHLTRGPRGTTFTAYRAEIVPKLWLLTKRQGYRIFQQIHVPDILKKIFSSVFQV